MIDYINKLKNNNLSKEYSDILGLGNIGIEKEALRVEELQISLKSHPRSLGSALCNPYITTDFSEAQPELITPPFSNEKKTLSFLEDIHHYFFYNNKEEILWPFSMPPLVNGKKIPIAYYGSSNLGLFKHIYRKGLSHRYGKLMQIISGVHFNYSLPNEIWENGLIAEDDKGKLENSNIIFGRSKRYFGMLRNVLRMNWVILYLFGASPILTKDFITSRKESFKRLDDSTFFLPYATSLRMSDYGYQNLSRVKYTISTNSLNEYVSDLVYATETTNAEYASICDDHSDSRAQISPNILQIEAEYYAIARAKSNMISNDRFAYKLSNGGVDFIELRSLDLNPFSRIGIDRETTLFLEVFLIYSFFKLSEPISNSEQQVIFKNDIDVAKYGRREDLKLNRDGKQIKLKDWAHEILDEMLPIAEILDSRNLNQYTKTIKLMKSRVQNPAETLSGVLLDKVTNNKQSFTELGNSIGESNKAYFLNKTKKENPHWELLERESNNSFNRQKVLEEDKTSFEDYKRSYFASD